MNRRQALRLLSAGLPAALVPVRRQDQTIEAEPWRFEIDGASRWSLRGAGRTVVDTGEIRVALANGVTATLGELDGVRRLRSGGRQRAIWSIVGRLDDVEVNAVFHDGLEPRIEARVRGLDEARALERIHFTDGVSVAQASAWLNGYQSWSPSQVVSLGAATSLTSHGQLALLGQRGLGLLFDESDGGAGEFRLRGRRLDATSLFGGRLVGAAHSPAIATLSFLPSNDALGALAGACASRAGAPTGSLAAGWRSWHAFPAGVSEAAMVATLEGIRARFDPRALRVIQLDDGYQRAAGDWGMNAAFPSGHEALAARIRSAGYEPALWMAPFAVCAASGIPAEHPEWLVAGPDGVPLTLDQRSAWGGRVHALDASQREVQDWLRGLARRATADWGYGRLVLDHLHYGAAGGRRIGGASAHEALRQGLRALREGTRNAALVACAVPLQHALGRADAVRTGDQVRHNWDGVKLAARGLLMRQHLARRAWVSDPDAALVGGALTLDEARAWASVVAVSGAVTMSSDALPGLGEERLEILQRVMPAQPLAARVLDGTAARGPRDDPPSWLLARVQDDWWMVAAVNWGDAPRRLTMSLDAHGVRGPLAAYDVWAGERVADVRGALSFQLAPHSARVLGLRRPKVYPFVLGSSRHLVQGAVDVVEEHWDPAKRTLSGKCTMLDGRPYRLTVGVPAGRRAAECTANVPCTLTETARSVALEFAPTRDDQEWTLQF